MGFLYVRRSWIERLVPPLLDNHAADWVARDRYQIRQDARRFENWECNVAAKLGLGAAVDYALDLGLEPIWRRVEPLAARLRAGLSEIPGVTVRDLGAVKGGIVTFTVAGVDANEVCAQLNAARINANTSSVLSARFDMEARGLERIVRTSLHYITAEEELATLVDRVSQIAGPRA
jgi:selenocysteine lyase/cysteine desulfurase